jgi:copper transport protein
MPHGDKRSRSRCEGTRRSPTQRWALTFLIALGLGLFLALLALLPIGPTRLLVPVASAHSLHASPVRSDPPASAILQAPPARVRMWFSEDLNPLTSHLWVIDPANHEVDRGDSHVSDDDAREMEVSLPLLPAGMYVVVWRTQSAEDGHVAGSSYYFRIARPDGTVPPIPAVLPTGHVPGAAGTGAAGGAGLDGPTLAQAVATWLALLFMTFWVGGVIWETWMLPPVGAEDSDLVAAGRAAARRFRRLGIWALAGVLVADVAMVLGLAAALTGDWSGLLAPRLLGAILFGSRFGLFWWMRQVVAVAALTLAVLEQRGMPFAVSWRADTSIPPRAPALAEPTTLTEWSAWSVAAIKAAPGALVQGWRRRTLWGRAVLLLAAALLAAFALSGHAAAVPQSTLAYALAVDLLHLAGTAAWLGGVIYIAIVLVPALKALPDNQRAAVLARGLPQFSALALAMVAILALTGTLNATIHLTAPQQLATTAYGRTLFVKSELFLIMACVSAYHAFRLRPRLARALAAGGSVAGGSVAGARPGLATASVALQGRVVGTAPTYLDQQPGGPWAYHNAVTASGRAEAGARPLSAEASRLATALEDWLRREAVLGVGILLCVALLAAFAGSLTPTTPAGATSPTSTGASGGAFISQPQTVDGLSVILKVTPDTFGTNTFTVTLRDAHGQPVDGASVLIETEMLDMDMGIQTAQLQPIGPSAPGSYSGQSDLDMAGHWRITVKVLPPHAAQFTVATFTFSATY